MTRKHTRGPWEVIEDVDRFEIDAPSRSIAVTTDNRTDDRDNAALIAAAPDMKLALEAARQMLRIAADLVQGFEGLDTVKRGLREEVAAITATLAKAEGL